MPIGPGHSLKVSETDRTHRRAEIILGGRQDTVLHTPMVMIPNGGRGYKAALITYKTLFRRHRRLLAKGRQSNLGNATKNRDVMTHVKMSTFVYKDRGEIASGPVNRSSESRGKHKR